MSTFYVKRSYKIKTASTFFIAFFCFSSLLVNSFDRAVLVHNTIEEIEACKGKLHLKLIRVWGGDEDEDVNKFFKYPCAVVIDKKESVYISDLISNCIKVFNYNGKYLRNIGQKGRGPGDLFGPVSIAFSPMGDIWIGEKYGQRIQCISTSSYRNTIFKFKGWVWWIGVNSKNEVAVYSHKMTFNSRKLLSIFNEKGKLKREIGVYHDKSKNIITAEKLEFLVDGSDNFYAANMGTPVIRKYAPGGRLLMAITFDTPFNIPVKITLNSREDEIERLDQGENQEEVRVKRKNNGVTIQIGDGKDKKSPKYGICLGMGTDSQNNIYIVTNRRLLTEKEIKATYVFGNDKFLNRSMVDYDIVENIDVNRLLVFNENGKVEAEAQLSTFCDDIYIHNNRLFIIDGFLNQRILEYEMSFD